MSGTTEAPGFRVVKLGYSRGPWRIVSPDGLELSFPKTIELWDHSTNRMRPTVIDSAGHDTKAAALETLAAYAWRLHTHVTNQQENTTP